MVGIKPMPFFLELGLYDSGGIVKANPFARQYVTMTEPTG
jgi:hypothetical protein